MRTQTPAHGSLEHSEQRCQKNAAVRTRGATALNIRLVTITLTLLFATSSSVDAQEYGCSTPQLSTDGCASGGYYANGSAGQLFPYDQQDTWLHGQHQRVPSYGGYGSFRPYNYRHVASQTQIASRWGATHGMTYSQQFFNKYRGSYLDGNLQAKATNSRPDLNDQATPPQTATQFRARPASFPRVQPTPEQAAPLLFPMPQQSLLQPQQTAVTPSGPPIHVYPESASLRN